MRINAAGYSDAAMTKLQSMVGDEIARALDGLPARSAISGPHATIVQGAKDDHRQ
jgi:hypothetical protein